MSSRWRSAFTRVRGRRPEICTPEWDWTTSQTGVMMAGQQDRRHVQAHERGKPSAAFDCAAPRVGPYVPPSPKRPGPAPDLGEHHGGWCRVLKAAGVPHVGTHGIRHRSATDIANSGIPVKVGMEPTQHKTVAQFMQFTTIPRTSSCAMQPSWASGVKPSPGHGRTDPVETDYLSQLLRFIPRTDINHDSGSARCCNWEGSLEEGLQEALTDVQKDMGVALFIVQLGSTPHRAKP